MAITFECPGCTQAISVKDDMAGKRGKCPGCGGVVVIPGRAAASRAAAPQARGVAASASADGEMPCPMCGEHIKAAAIKCRFCGEFLDGGGSDGEDADDAGTSPRDARRRGGSPRRSSARRGSGRGESPYEWQTAALLCFFLGGFGVHRFYTGHTMLGVLQLVTLGGCGLWSLIDFILILTDNYTDAQGLRLRR